MMNTMTNEEKAKELATTVGSTSQYIYRLCLQMAQWKDEQFAKDGYTKEQLRKMGFPFTLNGDIVSIDELNKDLGQYIKWKNEQFAAEKAALIDKIVEEFDFQNFTYVDIDGGLFFDYDKFSTFLEKVSKVKIIGRI